MQFDITVFLTNPFIPIFFATCTGLLFGKIKVGNFSFGQSGTLFTGIIAGWFLYSKYAIPFIDPNDPNKGAIQGAPAYAVKYLKDGVISTDFFTFTLILFIASVGLLASKDLLKVIKIYGTKFVILAMTITGTGALAIYLATLIFKGQDPFAVSGVYTGALNSSPGFAAALEAVAKYGKEAQAQVGLGHTIGYAPGLLMNILVMSLFPTIFKMDMEKEKERYRQEMGIGETASAREVSADEVASTKQTIKEAGLDIVAFMVVCIVGYFLGSVKIYLPFVKWFSLASTGGILISALVLGSIGQIGPLKFRMDSKILGAIRDLSVTMFLAIVGLEYGYTSVTALAGSGALLAAISFGAGLIAMIVGFIVGRYIFKMNWIVLAGAMCGGATSTPGLGAAINTTKTNEVAGSYGAAYPFGLICKVVFVIILHTIT